MGTSQLLVILRGKLIVCQFAVLVFCCYRCINLVFIIIMIISPYVVVRSICADRADSVRCDEMA